VSLADDINNLNLSAYPKAVEAQYRPSVEFDGSSAIIATGTVYQDPDQPPEYAELLRKFGRDPERFRLAEILYEKHWEVPYRPYVRGEDGEPIFSPGGTPLVEEQQFRWAASYKVRVEEITPASSPDFEAIVLRARAWPPAPTTGPHWLVFQAGDLQLGKVSRDGSTDEIVARYAQAVDAAAAEFKRLRCHGIEGIQISMPGDCLEGNQSQKGKNQRITELVITDQVLMFKRLLVHTVETLAPLANQVFLDVVNGNHDEAERDLNTWPGNGWATAAATLVDDDLKANPIPYRHVQVRVPDKWSGNMTVPVGDTVVTVVHGHQWSRAVGPMKWWADQAVNNQPAGAAQLLQFGHWHEFQTRSNAHRMAIGSPTFDCGSDWYREKTGATSKRGGLVYLLRSGEVSRLTLV